MIVCLNMTLKTFYFEELRYRCKSIVRIEHEEGWISHMRNKEKNSNNKKINSLILPMYVCLAKVWNIGGCLVSKLFVLFVSIFGECNKSLILFWFNLNSVYSLNDHNLFKRHQYLFL